MKTIVTELYDYGCWANDRILAVASKLDAEQLGRKLTKGADPILQTFGHLVSADVRWLARWRGEMAPALSAADYPSLDAVRQGWKEHYLVRRAYIASMDEATLLEDMLWVRDQGSVKLPRWQAMVHCANHGTQHRSEIAAMLTDLGHSPGNMDMVIYYLDMARRS